MVDYKGQVLQKAKNFLEPPGHGCGQGNGGGPTFWVLVSTLLLQVLRVEGFGTHFCGMVSNGEIIFIVYAFVDDTNSLRQKSIHGTQLKTWFKTCNEQWTHGEG